MLNIPIKIIVETKFTKKTQGNLILKNQYMNYQWFR